MKSSTSSTELPLPQPIRIELHASPHLALFLVVAHAGALFSSIAIELIWTIKLSIAIAILWSLFHTLCQHAFRCSRSAITTLVWTDEGVWKLWTRDGRLIPVPEKWPGEKRIPGKRGFPHRAPDVRIYVHPRLVVLHFGVQKRLGRSVILHPGMVDDVDVLRRLRVRLRFSFQHPGNHA